MPDTRETAPPSRMASILGGLAFLVLAGTLAGGPLASMTQPPSPPVLVLIVSLALALAHARHRLAGYRRMLAASARATPDLRRKLVETENQRDRLGEEALRKAEFETGFAGLVEEMQSAALYREKVKKERALRRLEAMRLSRENRALRRSMSQARVDLTVLRERIDRLASGRVPTHLARVRSALHAFRAGPEILESIRKLEGLGTVGAVVIPGRRRERRLVSGQPSRWDRPRIPWRSPDSRAPATRCP